MRRYQVGERVYCISHTDEEHTTMYVFGPGIYEGDFIPDEKAVGMAAMCREAAVTNPRIKLDSGEVIYGAECWWGSEAGMQKQLQGRTVVTLTVEQQRKSYEQT